ncbi:MAG: primosomal protein N' [Marmoricola sp.]
MASNDDDGGDQLALVPAVARSRRPRPSASGEPTAEVDPVASVLVDVALAHLDRPFEYWVPASMATTAVPGARVKVSFAGRDVDGFVVARGEQSDGERSLRPLRRVVSAEPVLTPEVAALVADVATRWVGTRSDVLRLAIPPRRAKVEAEETPPAPDVTVAPDPTPWRAYEAGDAWLSALSGGKSPHAVWSALPGADWTHAMVEAVIATAASGRGALVCVPDRRDVARLDAALQARLGEQHHAVLTADVGPTRRYRTFLAVARGACRIVIGTRAAAFAPVRDLGLVAIFDDGDDLFEEPRAPYPNTRDILLLRAQRTGCAALVGGFAQSVESQYLLRTGWARPLTATRDEIRAHVAPRIAGASDAALGRAGRAGGARIPPEAFEALRGGLQRGPVLVQVARTGYAVRLACETCRTRAACANCHGPLRIPHRAGAPECAWCGLAVPSWTCAVCGGHGLRAPMIGADRTVEEIGRAFPGVVVRQSAGDSVLERVPDKPALIVATAGAEPVAENGYAAVVLLDTAALLAREELRAEEEALRRWMNAAALARPAHRGGEVVVVGEPAQASLQALVRWDPGGFASRELEERAAAHLPPASVVATLTAPPAVLEGFLEELDLPEHAEVLGPLATDVETHRAVVRVPRAERDALTAALRQIQGARSTRKRPHVRVQLDPYDID